MPDRSRLSQRSRFSSSSFRLTWFFRIREYCERALNADGSLVRQWCSYPNLVDISHQETINRVALETGHGRGGAYDFVFDTTLFYDQSQTPDIDASHGVSAASAGSVVRSGMSGGQAEAARAARMVMGSR